MITNGKEEIIILLGIFLYNLYSRKNPYFIYLDLESPDGIDGTIQDGNLTPKVIKYQYFPFYHQ